MCAQQKYGKVSGNLETEVYGKMCSYTRNGKQFFRKAKSADKGEVAVGKRMGAMALANVNVVYKAMLPLLEDTMAINEKDERQKLFRSRNAKYCHFALTPEEVDKGGSIVNEYVVSKGNLPKIEIDEWGTSSIALPGIKKLDRFMKKGDVCKAILEGNKDWKEGDVLVFVRARQMMTDENVPIIDGAIIRMVMDVTDEEILGMAWPQDSMDVTDGKMSYSGGNEAVGYCWIHLRPADKAEKFGVEQYGDASTQQLKITNMQEIQAQYRTVERVKMAIEAWEKRRLEKKEKPKEKPKKTVEEMIKGW